MPQYFRPSRFVISGITLGQTTTVTMLPTTINHVTVNANYVIGQLVRLLITEPYGSFQLNEDTGYVLSIPSLNQIVVAIDSSQNVGEFVAANTRNPPQIVAVGDVNTGYQSHTGPCIPFVGIPGSFINISPH